MKIKRTISDLLESNMYLLIAGEHAIVIDPCRDTLPGVGYQIDMILLTHEHYDHISGVNVWKQRFRPPVLCSQACAENCLDPRRNMSRYFNAFCELQSFTDQKQPVSADEAYSCEADFTFTDRVSFSWRGNELELFELPGHSMGGIGILVNNRKFFAGDSLWKDREVELGFRGGSKKKWVEISVPRLQHLPEEITIYPGHGEPFECKEELEKCPCLK